MGAAVTCVIGAGRRSSFEVTANGKTVFSKLTKGAFPEDNAVVVADVKAVLDAPAAPATEAKASA